MKYICFWLFVGSISGLLFGPFAEARAPLYDFGYMERQEALPADPGACLDVYLVYRPVAPLINHLFVGIARAGGVERLKREHRDSLRGDSADSDDLSDKQEEVLIHRGELRIYGAVKGESDFAYFERAYQEMIAGADLTRQILVLGGMEFWGRLCGEQAARGLDAARERSLDWLAWLSYDLYFYPRILATPALGRPCALAAWDVLETLAEIKASSSTN